MAPAGELPGCPCESCAEHDGAGWSSLPPDLLLKVGALLSGDGHTLSGMRGACSSWRDAAAGLESELAPLGATPYLAAFPLPTSIDYARRGQGHSLRDKDLALVCAGSSGSLRALDVSGAFQLTAAGVGALAACQRLTRLRCTDSTLLDSHVEALGALASLEELSLSRCLFLRGDFFPALLPCSALRSLDLAGCGLGLAINPGAVEALAALSTLTHLDLSGGNGVGDDVAAALAQMPALRSLRVRGAAELGDAGLHLLAAGPAAAQLHTLDLSGCTRLSDAAWAALACFPGLEELGLAELPGLLRHLPLPEQMAGAAWRWGRLRRLSLAGSCVHPSKLVVLAATCGGTLEELDMGDGGKRGVAYRRLTPSQLADLAGAARQLRALRRFSAAGAELPLGACLTFMRRAPGLLTLDLSRCSLDDGSCPPPAGWGLGLGGLTSARRQLDFNSFPAAAGVSLRSLMQQQAPAEPATSAKDFACALGQLSHLQTLKLAGCAGLGPAHLSRLSACTALTELSLAGAAGGGDAAAAAVAASAPRIASLDLSATQLSDAGLAALAGAASLAHLSVGRNGAVTEVGLRAVAAGPAGRALRSLDASGCGGLGDEAAAALAAGLPSLHTLALSGCGQLSAVGLTRLCALRHLRSLSLARCAAAVSDDSLHSLASRLPGLTRLDLSSSAALTQEGLAAALALLPCLADLDLTGSQGLRDDDVGTVLLALTRANVQMPGGANSPTGSPLRRRVPSQH